MKLRVTLVIVLTLLFRISWVLCFVDPITLSVGGIGIGFLGVGYQKYVKCKIFECCNDDSVPINVTELQKQLATRLYGQHIAQETIIRAMRGYKVTEDPPKALALSFHGPSGTGKNYVTQLIGASFYKRGLMSKFFHMFSGSTFSKSRMEEHKEAIKNIIVETLQRCERSVFVFDEVHKMPEGLLEVLVPFLDYTQPIFIEHKSTQIRLNSNKAVFIFLTNACGTRIVDETVKFWLEGRKRDSLRLRDYEHFLSSNAWQEKGGFLNSNTIKSSLIDYYVPFLPLEAEHIKLCVKDAFESDRYSDPPTPLMEDDVLSTIIYGPSPYNIFATGGCKRIETKVSSARQMNNPILEN